MDVLIARTSNTRHLKLLEVVRLHLLGEAQGDPDKVMQTLGPDPVYKVWGAPERMNMRGSAQVDAYYRHRFGVNRLFVEFDPDRIVVDDDTVVTDLRMRYLARGAAIAAPDAYPVGGVDVEHDDDVYLISGRLLVIWPFDGEGRLGGEEAYTVIDDVRRLTPEEVADSIPAEVLATYS